MSRTVTPAQLLARLRENCDIENDTHSDDAELYGVLSSALAETWDVIVASGLAEQYVKSVTFSAVAGQLEYPLSTAVSAGDFYKVAHLYVVEGTNRLRSIPRVNPAEIEAFTPPTATSTLKLYYIPNAPTIATDGSTPTSIEGFNGWEEHILACAEITVRKKREEDYSGAYRRKQEVEARIQRMANTDWSQPSRVVRRRSAKRILDIHNSNITAWGIRGGKIELYECDLYGVVR